MRNTFSARARERKIAVEARVELVVLEVLVEVAPQARRNPLETARQARLLDRVLELHHLRVVGQEVEALAA